jgi:hypothetical protein
MIVIANVVVSPSTIPSGRRVPPDPLADSIAGSTGSTQGETAVPAPTTTANSINTTTTHYMLPERDRRGCNR